MLRDGWLYVIDSVTGHLHEYQVLNGLVSALLHKGAKVDSDRRTPIEERPALVFSRRSTLHVTFAEVQWTAAKCVQVLDSREEREQRVKKWARQRGWVPIFSCLTNQLTRFCCLAKIAAISGSSR
ncbi:toxin VasX [Pseudomonas sp. RT4P38]